MTRSELRENLLVALDTLHSHKVRSALTVLGIVIGVTSVVSVAAIIEGLNRHISEKVEGMGSRTYFISRISISFSVGSLPEEIRKREYLEFSDTGYVRESCPSLRYVTAFVSRPSSAYALKASDANEIRHGHDSVEQIFIRGVEPDYVNALPIFAIAQGRFITSYDEDHARSVIVLGDAIAGALFPRLDPIGKTVRFNGRPYEVIGVFEQDPGLFGGPGIDQMATIPLSNFRKRYPENKEAFISFTVDEDADIAAAVNEVVEAMRRRRKVPASEENDFEVISPDFLTDLWDQLTSALVLLTGIISSIGLLVGGIGVMNIMLISVTERTTEIGVRKAIGARRSDIRAQFLMEAVTLTLVGGAIGIFLGALIALLVRSMLPTVPATLSYLWVGLGVTISVAVGLFFGYYPANRAASLDPIVCLRYE